MSKTRKTLSVITSAAITASMLSAFAVTAGAETSELFSYDFESGDAWTIAGSNKGNYNNAFVTDETLGSNVYNLSLTGGNQGGRSCYVTIPKTAEADYVKVSFDWYSNTTVGNCGTDVIIQDSSGNGIFKISDKASGVVLNGDATTLGNSKWYKIEAVFSFDTKQVISAAVLSEDDGTVLASQKHAAFISEAAADIGRIGISSSRASGATMSGGAKLDNFKAEAVTDEYYIATLSVKDSSGNAVDEATVTFDDRTFTTDADGIVKVAVAAGEYSYKIEKNGYEATPGAGDAAEGTITVADSNAEENITYSPKGYTAIPDVVVMTGGQKSMTAPRTADSFSSAEFSVSVTDQEGVAIEDADIEWSIEPSDENVSVADGIVTVMKGFDGGNTHIKTFTVTATASKNGGSKAAADTIAVSDYLFYESATGGSSYGTAELHEVNGVQYITTGSSKNSTAVITIPEPITFEAGTAELLSFSTTITNKNVYTFRRSIVPTSSADESIVSLDFVNLSIGGNTTWSSSNSTLGTVYGSVPEIGSWQNVSILFKTNSEGVTTATLTIGDQVTSLGVISAADLGKIKLIVGDCGGGTDRYVAVKDITVESLDVAGLDLFGADKLTTVAGKTVSRTYEASVMVAQDDETFIWSTTIPGAVITPSEDTTTAILTVPGTTSEGGTVTVTSSTSTEEQPKTATMNVTIEAAHIQSAALSGKSTIHNKEGLVEQYTISDVIDQFGDDITEYVTTAYSSSDPSVLAIDAETGEATVKAAGTTAITAVVSAGESVIPLTKDVTVKSMYLEGTTSEVDASSLTTSSSITGYIITTARDGVIVNQTEVTEVPASVDLTDADSYEIDPIYTYNIPYANRSSYTVDDDFADGFYNMTFTKGDAKRADININGKMVGNNVDQYGEGRSNSAGTEYTIHDAVVSDGSIRISLSDNQSSNGLTKAVIVKAPSNVTRKQKVYIIGDSLVAEYYGTYPEPDETNVIAARTGWGQQIDNFFTDDVEVVNLANSGSTAYSLYQDAFPGIMAMAQPGDWFVLESGYNEQAAKNKEADSKMIETIEAMVDEAESKGLHVVLVSPNASQHDYRASVSRTAKMAAAASEMQEKYGNITYIDLSRLSYEFMMGTGISTTADEAAKVIEAIKDENGVLTSVSIADAAAGAPVLRPNYGRYTYYIWNSIDGGSALKPVSTSSSTEKIIDLYSISADRLHSTYTGAMKFAEIVAQGLRDAGADFINTEFSYTFTDPVGNVITCQIK